MTMIKEFYELSQAQNNGEGKKELFAVSLRTASATRMELSIIRGSEKDDIVLTNEQITMLLKICKMVKQNQLRNDG